MTKFCLDCNTIYNGGACPVCQSIRSIPAPEPYLGASLSANPECSTLPSYDDKHVKVNSSDPKSGYLADKLGMGYGLHSNLDTSNASGTGYKLSLEVKKSSAANNAIQVGPDGLYVQQGVDATQDSNTVAMRITAGKVSSDVILNPSIDNAVTADASGLTSNQLRAFVAPQWSQPVSAFHTIPASAPYDGTYFVTIFDGGGQDFISFNLTYIHATGSASLSVVDSHGFDSVSEFKVYKDVTLSLISFVLAMPHDAVWNTKIASNVPARMLSTPPVITGAMVTPTVLPIHRVSVSLLDTSSIAMANVNGVIQSTLKLSAVAGNTAMVKPDGLYVSGSGLSQITPVDTLTVDTVIGADTIESNVKVSAQADNTLVVSADGLYVPLGVSSGYVHPTGDGYSHIPATGTASAGKVLKAGASANSASWGYVSYTDLTNTPTLATALVDGYMSKEDKAKLDASGTGSYIKVDGTTLLNARIPFGSGMAMDGYMNPVTEGGQLVFSSSIPGFGGWDFSLQDSMASISCMAKSTYFQMKENRINTRVVGTNTIVRIMGEGTNTGSGQEYAGVIQTYYDGTYLQYNDTRVTLSSDGVIYTAGTNKAHIFTGPVKLTGNGTSAIGKILVGTDDAGSSTWQDTSALPFIRKDGVSTTTAKIPFAEGLSIAPGKWISPTSGSNLFFTNGEDPGSNNSVLRLQESNVYLGAGNVISPGAGLTLGQSSAILVGNNAGISTGLLYLGEGFANLVGNTQNGSDVLHLAKDDISMVSFSSGGLVINTTHAELTSTGGSSIKLLSGGNSSYKSPGNHLWDDGVTGSTSKYQFNGSSTFGGDTVFKTNGTPGVGKIAYGTDTTGAWSWTHYSLLPVVTTSVVGMMSAADKIKLDGIASNANNYVHPATHPQSVVDNSSGWISTSLAGKADTSHNQSWSTITSTPTTLAGYGITNAVSSTDPRLSDSRTPLAHNQAWSTITSTPTTLAGYGVSVSDTLFDSKYGQLAGTNVWTGANNTFSIATINSLALLQANLEATVAYTRYQSDAGHRFSMTNTGVLSWGSGADAGDTRLSRKSVGVLQVGTQAIVVDNDPRLTDSRTPVAHTHVVANITDYTTATDSRIGGYLLTTYSVGANTALLTTDTLLGALGKIQGQLNAREGSIPAGSVSQYLRGDKSWATLDKTAVGLGSVLNVAQEPALGNPASNGYALVSTAAGSRSWVAMPNMGLYLPLAGGALTGALSGTTSTMSGLSTASGFKTPGGLTNQALLADGSTKDITYVPRCRKFQIGDGTSTSYIITHNYGNSAVMCQVTRVSNGGIVAPVAILWTNGNSCTLTFATAPTTNEYNVIVLEAI